MVAGFREAFVEADGFLRVRYEAGKGQHSQGRERSVIGGLARCPVASCTPRLIAAARPRVSCRTTSSPAASAMATEASVLPPSTAKHLRRRRLERGERAQ